jgi:hypothetical protein
MAKIGKIVWKNHEWGKTTELMVEGHQIKAQVALSMVEGLTWYVACDGRQVERADDYAGTSAYADAEAAIRRVVAAF